MTVPSDDPLAIPALPRRWTAPEPVIVVGMLGWLLATAIVYGTGSDWTLARSVCPVGFGVGLVGTAIVAVQKLAVRRGRKGAQQGLDG